MPVVCLFSVLVSKVVPCKLGRDRLALEVHMERLGEEPMVHSDRAEERVLLAELGR